MGSREDDEYWNQKYDEVNCEVHGNDYMWYDTEESAWSCGECDELEVTYKYG